MNPQCAIGKDLNPKTCRYIKSCRKGYNRNRDFKCVKTLKKIDVESARDRLSKEINYAKEQVKLMKDLFSTSRNGLVNSPPIKPRTTSKHIIKTRNPARAIQNANGLENSPPTKPRKKSKHITVKFHPSKINEIPVKHLSNPLEIQLKKFIEKNGKEIIKMTYGEAKELARKNGFELFTEKDKKLYKNLLIDYSKFTQSPELNYSKPMMGLSKMDYAKYKRESIAKMKNASALPEQTRFMFYLKSTDAKPGKGAGEHLAPEDTGKYEELSRIKDWRKKLSNFWIAPFTLNGKRWASVEHYYQGSKFKGTPEYYNQFSLDSGSELSKNPLLAKAAGGKTGKFQGKLIRPNKIVIDRDFFEGIPGELYRRSDMEMNIAQDSKFLQNEDLKELLKLTKNAQLIHYQRGTPVVFYNLMKLRSDLLNGKLVI